MDSKGWRDDVFIERPWRSVNEEVYLRACDTASESRTSICGALSRSIYRRGIAVQTTLTCSLYIVRDRKIADKSRCIGRPITTSGAPEPSPDLPRLGRGVALTAGHPENSLPPPVP
jgi:hypothetical protein